MPICMNGELCLGMVQDIICSVNSLLPFQAFPSTMYSSAELQDKIICTKQWDMDGEVRWASGPRAKIKLTQSGPTNLVNGFVFHYATY